MVFNTGAALLDAIVLAVVPERKELTDTRLHRMCGRSLMYRNPLYIRCCGDCRRMNALWSMIWNLAGETADTIS